MKQSGFWESFILVAIVLVLVQTFVEELATLLGWPVNIRHLLVFTGLFFDLLFSIEYLIRQFRAAVKKEGLEYFLHRRGWIDLAASLPLLFLNSGPMALLLLSDSASLELDIGVLNLMKIVKAVRITRVLRFIRMIKLFGKIYNAESKMAQRHVSRLASMSVVIIILVVMLGSIPGRNFGIEAQKEKQQQEYSKLVQNVRSLSSSPDDYRRRLEDFLETREDFIRVSYPSGEVFGVMSERDFRQNFVSTDYTRIKTANMSLFVSLRDFRKARAWENIVLLLLIIMLVLGFVFFYAKHFAQTVSDVIHVMRRGMQEPDYNLQVRMQERYKDDEIFDLARLYNEQWLVLKDKYRPLGEKQKGAAAQFSMDEFLGKQ